VATSVLGEMVEDMERYLDEQPVTASSVSITGIGALWLQLQDYITHSQIRGFLLAFTVIAALLCFVFQSMRIGLVAMIPNLSPVVCTLGFMGWFDIPLDYVRLLIASVAIGISVDDTIHHVTRYQAEFRRSGSYERALYASMADVGRALFITSAVLIVGFLMLTVSRLDTMLLFGTLLAITIGLALIADFFLMPALVMTVKPFGPEWAATAAASESGESLASGPVARAPGT
jgi:predicted RND superfamily exporter protein